MDLEKLAKMQGALRIGGKGTPRRKVIARPRPQGQGDDKKLQGALKKLNVQPIQGVEEVNMFKENGNVLHFTAPKVHAAVGSNTYAIYGNGVEKELTELVPGILNQLGPEAISSLRKIAETYQSQVGTAGGLGPGGVEKEADEAEDDDEGLPELVTASGEPAAQVASNSLEDVN